MPGGDVQGNRVWDTLDTSGSPHTHPTVSQMVERRDTAIEVFVRMERTFDSTLMSRAFALAEREKIDKSFEVLCRAHA